MAWLRRASILGIGRQALALQAIPIGIPDAAPRRQYQKKAHGKTDARGLTGAEIAQKELKAHEAKACQASASREMATVAPDEEDKGQVLVADTPPRPGRCPCLSHKPPLRGLFKLTQLNVR
jgi:hypothetical protein